jgi:hypothetical protein
MPGTPEFGEEAHRQSALAASTSTATDDQAWVDDISQFNDEDFNVSEEDYRPQLPPAPRPVIPMGDGPDAGELLRGMRDKERY